jgi:hypothetical protein
MWNFLGEIILFLFSVVLCFYLPGKLFLNKLNIHLLGISGLFVTLVMGLTSFTLILYILSWLHLVWLAFPFVIGIAIYVIHKKLWTMPLQKKERYPLLFLALCSVIFSLPLVLYGIHGNTIVYQYDDLWHLSLMQEMKVNFPPGIPIYAGVPLQGYHFFSDFLQANISNLFFISPFNLHFYFFSLLISLLWGFGVYTLMFTWTKKISTALWAVFLTMFGGSFAYILHLQGHQDVSLKEGLKMLQPSTILYNPPLALSIVVLLFCLTLLFQYLKTREKKWMIPFIIAAGLLPMFKVYAGIILYGGFVLLVLFELLKKRYFLLQILMVTGILSLLTFGIFLGAGGGFIWYPFWPPHELLRDFKWYGYDEKIYTYNQQHVIRGIIQTEVYGFSLFLLGNLGTRLVGVLALLLLLKKNNKPSIFSLVILVMLLISIIIPLLFIQTGKVFEIIQMTNYYLFFVSLFAAIGLTKIFSLRYRFWKIGMIAGIILFAAFTLPSTIFSFNAIVTGITHPSSLSDPYYKALFFLRTHGEYNDTVLVLPSEIDSKNINTLLQWQLHTSPEIPAFINKRVYLGGTGIRYSGMDTENRIQNLYAVRKYLQKPSQKSAEEIKNFLAVNKIRFIFSPYNAAALIKVKGVTQIFNDRYYIYAVENK